MRQQIVLDNETLEAAMSGKKPSPRRFFGAVRAHGLRQGFTKAKTNLRNMLDFSNQSQMEEVQQRMLAAEERAAIAELYLAHSQAEKEGSVNAHWVIVALGKLSSVYLCTLLTRA